MQSSKISLLNSQDMIKLRNNLSFIPIQVSGIRRSLDDYKDLLDYKSEFINSHHYNTSLSPIANDKKATINTQAKKLQDDLTAIYKIKLKKEANRLLEIVKEQGEIESEAFDSIILRNLTQKVKVDEISRRIAMETYRAKVQKFNMSELRKKVIMQRKDKNEKDLVWNKVKLTKRGLTEKRANTNQSINDFQFLTQNHE